MIENVFSDNNGMSFRRITHLQFELNCNFPMEIYKEFNPEEDLYWNYFVRVEYDDYGNRCEQYAENYKNAVQCLLHMPKGKITIITMHKKTIIELAEKRKYKYFYN